MKVLHLYSGNLYGGVETYLVTLARCRHLCPEMEPHFGLCFPGRLRDELISTGVEVHDLGPVRLSRPWTILRARRRLKQMLRAHHFDVAVVHMSWPHVLFAPVIRKAGIRLVHALHAPVDRRHWLNRWAARTRPDCLLANSHFIARDAAGWFPEVPIHTCYLPVDSSDSTDREKVRRTVRAELDTPSDAVVLLQASRLERWKGQAIHLEALGQLRRLPNWVVWLAGGPQRAGESEFQKELMTTASRLEIASRVRFLGQRTDVNHLLRAADIYCQPNSSPEPFGMIFVEALSAGLPVVTSNFGGGAEIVNDSCGILTPAGDTAAVSSALTKLIVDTEYRQRLGASGPERAREFCDPQQQLNCLLNLLGE